jgi:lysophospholipase L1-like esterase
MTCSKKIVCIGDSITRGLGVTTPWPMLLRLRLPARWRVVNKGVNGDHIDDMVTRFADDVAVWAPEFVIIYGGTNTSTPANVIAGITSMCNSATAYGGTSVLCTVTQIDTDHAYVTECNALITAYAKKNSLNVIDFYTVLDDPAHPGNINPVYQAFGVHPNDLGTAAMVASIPLSYFGI